MLITHRDTFVRAVIPYVAALLERALLASARMLNLNNFVKETSPAERDGELLVSVVTLFDPHVSAMKKCVIVLELRPHPLDVF